MLRNVLFAVCFAVLVGSLALLWNYLNPFHNEWLHFLWQLMSATIGYLLGKNMNKIFPWAFR